MIQRWRAKTVERDERGAFTLTELMLVGALSLIVLFLATAMLMTITGFSTETRNKIDAEVRARQSLDTAMRHLRNAVPLAQCNRWSATMPRNVDRMKTSAMEYCNGFGEAAPAINKATPTELEFFTYPVDEDTDPTKTIGSARAPDKFKISIAPDGPDRSALTIEQVPLSSNDWSMLAATCEMVGVGCPSTRPAIWAADRTKTIATFEVAPGSELGYLGSGGQRLGVTGGNALTSAQREDIRTILVDLSMVFEGRRTANYTGVTFPNGAPKKTFAYHASASLRGVVYADDRKGS